MKSRFFSRFSFSRPVPARGDLCARARNQRDLIWEVLTADPTALTSVLAETGWFKRAKEAIGASPEGKPQ